MAIFKKKPTGEEKSLIDFIARSRETGVSNKDIVEDMREKGYSNQQILDAMKKADLKSASGGPIDKLEPLYEPKKEEKKDKYPSPSEAGLATSDIEEITEKIIEEKWEGVKKELAEFKAWKEQASTAIEDIGKKIGDVASGLELLKKSISERINAYSTDIKDVSTDIKAMDKVFKDILPQLTSDVKELSGIVDKLKK